MPWRHFQQMREMWLFRLWPLENFTMGRRALTIRSWESLLWIVSPRYFQSYILRKSLQETSAISAALKGLICWYGEVSRAARLVR